MVGYGAEAPSEVDARAQTARNREANGAASLSVLWIVRRRDRGALHCEDVSGKICAH